MARSSEKERPLRVRTLTPVQLAGGRSVRAATEKTRRQRGLRKPTDSYDTWFDPRQGEERQENRERPKRSTGSQRSAKPMSPHELQSSFTDRGAHPLRADPNAAAAMALRSWTDDPNKAPGRAAIKDSQSSLIQGLYQGPDSLRILACRHEASWPRFHEHAADPNYAIVAVTLQAGDLELIADGRRLRQGRTAPGLAHLTPAGSGSQVMFRGSCDILHLYVPNTRLEGMAGEIAWSAADELKHTRLWAPDPSIERLAGLLVRSGELDAGRGALFLDGVAQAILARLLEAASAGQPEAELAPSLPKWRLKRVLDFIEEDLSRPLRLADLARSAGLSRMHFAAQFRASTGLRPHDYVVRRRIELARDMLRETEVSLAEIALAVGFQTQAHFTTVFRQLAGETPGRWRRRQLVLKVPPAVTEETGLP